MVPVTSNTERVFPFQLGTVPARIMVTLDDALRLHLGL